MPQDKTSPLNELIKANQEEADQMRNAGRTWAPLLQFDETTTILLVASCQFALRHPDFARTASAAPHLRRVIESLVAQVPAERPKLRELLEAGWTKPLNL